MMRPIHVFLLFAGMTLGVLSDTIASPSVDRRSTYKKTIAELARENVLSMKSNTVRCAVPRPKVVKVQDHHPHAYKRYVPSCIVLHRCEKDTGCCDDVQSVCSAKRRHRVTFYFYVVSLSEVHGRPGVENSGKVEPLRFINHTECECRKRRPPKVRPLKNDRAGGAVRHEASAVKLISLLLFLALKLLQ